MTAASLLVRLRFAVRYVMSPTAPLSPRERQFVAQIRGLQHAITDLDPRVGDRMNSAKVHVIVGPHLMLCGAEEGIGVLEWDAARATCEECLGRSWVCPRCGADRRKEETRDCPGCFEEWVPPDIDAAFVADPIAVVVYDYGNLIESEPQMTVFGPFGGWNEAREYRDRLPEEWRREAACVVMRDPALWPNPRAALR